MSAVRACEAQCMLCNSSYLACAWRHHDLHCVRSAARQGVLQDSQSSAMLPAHAAKRRRGDTCGAAPCLCCSRRPLLPADAPLLPCPAARTASMASISAARGLSGLRLLAGLTWQARSTMRHQQRSGHRLRCWHSVLAVPQHRQRQAGMDLANICNASCCKTLHPSGTCPDSQETNTASAQ